MAESRYEKYVCRHPLQGPFFQEKLVPFETQPPLIFSNGNEPIKGANQFVEVIWIWAPCVSGTGPNSPHYHTFDEMFIWVGSDPKNPNDLGAEVEFWLGTGADRDKVTFNTSTLVLVPKGLHHLPIEYKKVTRPVVHMTIGINSGEHKLYT